MHYGIIALLWRTGADGILTYFAKQVAEWLYLEGKINKHFLT